MPFPIATKAGGEAVGAPDVCVVPPPLPFVDTGLLATANGTATKVFIQMAPAIVLTSVLPSSTGDEPGKKGGVISGVNRGAVKFTQASSKVFLSGKPAVTLTCATGQNGDKPNVPGKVTEVAQEVVFAEL
jgi:Domain of unknown function (DUF4150)